MTSGQVTPSRDKSLTPTLTGQGRYTEARHLPETANSGLTISRMDQNAAERESESRRKEDGEEEADTLGLRIVACGIINCHLCVVETGHFYLNRLRPRTTARYRSEV